MLQIPLSKLKDFTGSLFLAIGMSADNAEVMTDIFMRATLRGVGHHDIYYLSERFEQLYKCATKKMNLNPKIGLIKSFCAIESYDGDNGPGELCSSFIMDRAEKLADKYGIAFCTVQNSNDFLLAAPYVEKPAEKRYIGIIYTRTGPGMNAPGSPVRVMNTSPMGFAAATDEGFPIMMDMCLAYASYGLLREKAALGEKVPSHWGVNAQGLETTDPAELIFGGSAAPIGGHKGFGLAILTEMLTGVLSGGQVIDEKQSATSRGDGARSQTAIVIKPSGLMPPEQFRARNSDMIKRMKAKVPGIHIPGEKSAVEKKTMEAQGRIDLKPELVTNLNKLARELGVCVLTA